MTFTQKSSLAHTASVGLESKSESQLIRSIGHVCSFVFKILPVSD